jgi:adenylosuccinate synthase
VSQRIHVVVGAQYGSEGKGHVAARIVSDEIASRGTRVISVRVAGPNAGHTVYDAAGNRFGLRSVPVGAVVSDDVVCYIAPGSEVNISVLLDEVENLRVHGHAVERLIVSGEVTLITDDHRTRESDEGLTDRIGSTGVGVGAARADRVMRTAKRLIDSPYWMNALQLSRIAVEEPHAVYAFGDASDQAVIVEGTQGYGLGLHAGFYPMATSSDARAIDFLAMADISPWGVGMELSVWVVARVNPIRVGGNSGWMKDETTWEGIGVEPELTTVTKKVRRVGAWDGDLVAKAVRANGGANAGLVISMADHLFPELHGVTDDDDIRLLLGDARADEFFAWLSAIEVDTGARVVMVMTSPMASFLR